VPAGGEYLPTPGSASEDAHGTLDRDHPSRKLLLLSLTVVRHAFDLGQELRKATRARHPAKSRARPASIQRQRGFDLGGIPRLFGLSEEEEVAIGRQAAGTSRRRPAGEGRQAAEVRQHVAAWVANQSERPISTGIFG